MTSTSSSSSQPHRRDRRHTTDAEMVNEQLNPEIDGEVEMEKELEREIAAGGERKLKTSDKSLKISTESTGVSRTAQNMNPDLYLAAKRGDIDFIKQLKAEDMERPITFQETPKSNTILHIAASSGHYQLVEAICQSHYELELRINSAGDLPLHVATSGGHLDLVKKMAGTELPKVKNNEGNTPLHLALINKYKVDFNLVLKSKYSEMADFLVQQEPEVSYYLNKEHQSPLYMAAEAGDLKLVKLMIEKANISQMPFEEVQLIAHAAITGKNIGVLESVLSRHPELIKEKDNKGMTPLSYAASIGYLEGVRYLLNKSTYCKYESDQNGSFPIHTASSKGHIKVIQEFLQRCPDSVELLNHQGRNILHVAAMNGKAKVVNYILKKPELEMLINEKDKDGNTSLHLASKTKHPKVVSILTWDKSVDLNLLNNEGKTALDVAGKYSGKVPSFRERLTWLALRYAGASHAARPSSNPGEPSSMDKYKDAVKENSQSSKPREAPNMDNYKDRVNTLLLVATLVATVTFAAGFTVPGGNDDSDPHKGMAKFLQHHLFQAFIISNTIAMYSSVTVVVALIWAQLGDLNLVIASLKFAVPILGLALIMVSSAFMIGSYLMVRGLNWLAYVVLIIGSFFILILTILFLPLCLPSSLPHPIFRYIVYYPFSLLIIVTKSNTNDREEK